MIKWEYMVVTLPLPFNRSTISGFLSLEDTLNHYGEMGWELIDIKSNVSFDAGNIKTFIFKRPIE